MKVILAIPLWMCTLCTQDMGQAFMTAYGTVMVWILFMTLWKKIHIIKVKLCYKSKFQKHTSLNVQYKLLHSISPLRRHATSPYPSCSPTHLRASPLKQKTQKHKWRCVLSTANCAKDNLGTTKMLFCALLECRLSLKIFEQEGMKINELKSCALLNLSKLFLVLS